MNTTTRNKINTYIIALSGVLTFIVLIYLFCINGLAPFGSSALTVMDADIQYLDFLAYYKDVLSGENSIGYTFTKSLGGSNIAVFSYYLASPFNLLLLFFDDSQIHSFFDIVVALKLTLAAIAFSFFSTRRFVKIERCDIPIHILSAVGYALCQYNLAQNSNFMWLDGVYMLPLILLQVSHIARGKASTSLPFLVAISIVFNWYSAGINCVFTFFWFLFECLLLATDKKISTKHFFHRVIKYVLSMILGIMISAVLFFPTVHALSQGTTKGTLNFSNLKNLYFLGQLPSAFQKYTYGATSDLGSPALFCGSLAIILAVYTIFCHHINIRKRTVYASLFCGCILACYWNPLYTAFSLFRETYSYHYRYSYICIFAILFLAIIGARAVSTKEHACRLVSIAITFSALQIILHYVKPLINTKYVYIAAVIVVLLTMLFGVTKFITFKNTPLANSFKKLIYVSFVLLGLFDLATNADILIGIYSTGDDEVKIYQTYRESQEDMINHIKSEDENLYRISQTSTRHTDDNGLTAYYNEGLSYNYASISGYTSCPDDISLKFLDKLGYPIMGEAMNITNTSILGADSILGVKYILSSYDINGLEKISAPGENGKSIYQNPYALPIAFTYTPTGCDIEDDANPFEYQNKLYQELFGLDGDIYTPLEYSVMENDDGYGATICFDMPDTSNVSVYGSIPWDYFADTSIYINDEFLTDYACWLTPTVFYIPSTQKACKIRVETSADNYNWNNVQIYALNLDALEKCSKKSHANKAEDISITNGTVTINTAKQNERLFLSVPANEGWTITINGEPAEVSLVGACLYSIKFVDGENHINMQYHVPYFRIGMVISILNLIAYTFCLVVCRKRLHKA